MNIQPVLYRDVKHQSSFKFMIFILIIAITFLIQSCNKTDRNHQLNIHFAEKYGQIEIGGKYVGAEFHHSRPLPSRLSFYYPVANSIVTSADYWHRDKSFPLSIVLNSESRKDTLGKIPYPYNYTPFSVKFENIDKDYKINFSYDVCDDLPVLVFKIILKNITDEKKKISLETSLQTSLRTSNTFSERNEALVKYSDDGSVVTAAFNYVDTDSAVVFIANVGEMPVNSDKQTGELLHNPTLHFTFEKELIADPVRKSMPD